MRAHFTGNNRQRYALRCIYSTLSEYFFSTGLNSLYIEEMQPLVLMSLPVFAGIILTLT